MKIELNNNKVYLDNHGVKKEIHPFWLRERVNGDKFVDIRTKQRLFDPTQIQENIKINDINLSKTDKLLKIILFAAIFELMFRHNRLRYHLHYPQ